MEEILSSLFAAGAVALLSLLWFIIMRRRESLFYMPRVIKGHSIVDNDESWMKSLTKFSEEELMKEKGGIDGALYLKFLKYATILFLSLTVFGVTILLPVYSLGKATDDGDPITGLDRYSLANVEEGSYLYWFAMASVLLFTLLSWIFTYKLYSQYVKKVNFRQYESTPVSRTIMVENVPKSITEDIQFKHFWTNLYGHRVKDAFLVPKVQTLSRFVKKRDKLRSKLLKATEKEEKSGKVLYHYEYYGLWKFVPLASRILGTKTESVSTYRRRLSAIDSLIQEERDKQHKRTHIGFVIFDSVASCMQAAQTLHKSKPTAMLVEPATDPSGVRWDSLHINRKNYVRKGLSYLSLLALFLFWSIPITVISALSNLENLAKVPGLNFLVDVVSLSPFIRGFVDGFLPSLALLLFLAFAPDIIYAILSVRGWYLQRNLDRRVFQNYWLFILVNVFLIITVVGSIFGALYNILERPATLVESLAESVPRQALFFTNYIILQGLLSIPLFHIARITDYIVWKIQTLRKNPREKREIPAKDMYIYFAENYGKNLLIFTIGLVYSSIAPIVLPFTFLYFVLSYISARYNWMYVIQPKYEGVRMTRLVIDRIFVGIFLYQLTMLGIFGLGKFYFGVGTTAIIIATMVYRYHLHRRFKMPSRYLALEKCPGPDKARGDSSKLFLHPSLKDNNEDEEQVEGEKEEHYEHV